MLTGLGKTEPTQDPAVEAGSAPGPSPGPGPDRDFTDWTEAQMMTQLNSNH